MPIHHSTELSIPARFAELPGLIKHVVRQAQQLGAAPAETLRIELLLEELVSNSIKHGYGGECDRLIAAGLRAGAAGLLLTYYDQAAAFDLSRITASKPADDQIGGLGINLILGFARSIRYQRQADGNFTELDL